MASLVEAAGQATLHIRESAEALARRREAFQALRNESLTIAEVEARLSRWLVEHGVAESELSGLGVRQESIRKAAPGRPARRK